MLASRALTVLLAAAVLGACSHEIRPVASLDGLAPGTTNLRVANNLGSSDEIEHIVLAVDGETLPLSMLPPLGGSPTTVASLRLAPGAHAMSARVTVKTHDGEVHVAGAQQPFWVARGAASIGLDVRAGDDATSAVALRVTILGGRTEAPADAAPDARYAAHDARCRGLTFVPAAICRTAADLEDAARRNDVVASICLHDRLEEMRRLALVEKVGDESSISMAEAQVAAVVKAAERCGAGAVPTIAPDGVTVTRAER